MYVVRGLRGFVKMTPDSKRRPQQDVHQAFFFFLELNCVCSKNALKHGIRWNGLADIRQYVEMRKK